MSLSNLSSPLSIFLLLSLFLFPSLTSSFNISQVLSQYPAYSTFSNYLAQVQLAADIDSRQPVTILVVDNSGMPPLSGKSMDVIKKVLSIHVLLDYYDVQKLQDLNGKSVIVTTLYQTTGLASGQVGFVNITGMNTGAVTFTSASDQSGSIGANLVKSVASEPYNLSVVQISTVIMPQFSTSPPAPSSPKPAPVESPAPVTSPVVSPVPAASPVPVTSPMPEPVPAPVPVKSPVPVISLVPVKSPAPVAVPVPVRSPAPVISPVPVKSPVPVISPVPVKSPVPVISPVPVKSPVPVISPVPVRSLVPVSSPVPVTSPAPMISVAPVSSPTPGPSADNGVTANSGINMGLTIMVSLLWAIFMQ